MAMLSGRRTYVYCRLCLTEIHDSNVTLLDGIIKDMLEIILPELNFSICETPSICKSCLETLKQSYSFKSSCLEVEDKVQDFVNPKAPTLIDLKEVLKKSNDIKHIPENLVVCRTCLVLGEESLHTKLCSYEGDPLQNMVEKCLPEMGLDLTSDSRICHMCLEQLEEQFHFIMQCLDTEAKINYYAERKRVCKDIDLHNVYLFAIHMEETDELEKQYGVGESQANGICDRGPVIKTEENCTKNNFTLENIKKENSDAEFVDLTDEFFPSHIKSKIEHLAPNHQNVQSHSNFENFNVHLFAQAEPVGPKEEVTFQIGKDVNGEDIITSETSQLSQEERDSDSDTAITKESELLEVKKVTKARSGRKKSESNDAKSSNLKPKSKYKYDDLDKSDDEFVSKVRRRTQKCKICEFKTKFNSRMKAHMTVNHTVKVIDTERQIPEDKIFRCHHCHFKTPEADEYKHHKLQHKKEREQKCPECNMVFIRADFLKKHIENHENPNKKPFTSTSRTPPNAAVKKKPTIINKPSPPSFCMAKPRNTGNMFSINGKVLKMFKCRICPYQTRLKSNYAMHAQTHKKGTEIVTHKCKICNFETIQKENFLAHMQTHQNDAGNKVMRCFLCSYQPATETALKQHVNQVHKSGTG